MEVRKFVLEDFPHLTHEARWSNLLQCAHPSVLWQLSDGDDAPSWACPSRSTTSVQQDQIQSHQSPPLGTGCLFLRQCVLGFLWWESSRWQPTPLSSGPAIWYDKHKQTNMLSSQRRCEFEVVARGRDSSCQASSDSSSPDLPGHATLNKRIGSIAMSPCYHHV
jgi:hypothetical protein